MFIMFVVKKCGYVKCGSTTTELSLSFAFIYLVTGNGTGRIHGVIFTARGLLVASLVRGVSTKKNYAKPSEIHR